MSVIDVGGRLTAQQTERIRAVLGRRPADERISLEWFIAFGAIRYLEAEEARFAAEDRERKAAGE